MDVSHGGMDDCVVGHSGVQDVLWWCGVVYKMSCGGVVWCTRCLVVMWCGVVMWCRVVTWCGVMVWGGDVV